MAKWLVEEVDELAPVSNDLALGLALTNSEGFTASGGLNHTSGSMTKTHEGRSSILVFLV